MARVSPLFGRVYSLRPLDCYTVFHIVIWATAWIPQVAPTSELLVKDERTLCYSIEWVHWSLDSVGFACHFLSVDGLWHPNIRR
ncbi:hypothetical protein BS47DRAFT_7651 [Hydnum rufescens UP504]|uniref:Uncharacterized protein n=1 Tax=Hydnum rufescens UP504 TaxID=1448309 RepID=A0A9P6BBQ2_9AGAM|nr:hypothetical protein BS47DRAFT_7651 [Hydnum rufescens UP504]